MRLWHLTGPVARRAACEFIAQAPEGFVVRVTEPTRSLEANAKLWACLHDVSAQVDWHGQKLGAEEWKDIFTAALKRAKVVPGLDGDFVVCGQSTSRMSKRDFSELLELMMAFGAEHGVQWSEPAMVDLPDVRRVA